MSADISIAADQCCSAHWHNITHNLGPMFRAAGVDWRRYQDDPSLTAGDLAADIRAALTQMRENPTHFKGFDASNGWGTYGQALPFLQRLLVDCERHPDGTVEVSL